MVDLPQHRLPGAVRHQRHATSRRWRSTSTRRARPRPRRGCGSSRSSAQSKAYSKQAAAAPLQLGILPFEEFKTKLSPERVSGRKKAHFDVAVNNTANGPLTVALDAADQDNELKYEFSPADAEIPPGQTGKAKMQVKPPRTRWIGRPEEKRIQVFTKTGEEAEQAKTAEDMDLPEGALEEGEDGEGGGHGAAAARWARPRARAHAQAHPRPEACGSARAACACRARASPGPPCPAAAAST